jgi:hypothetical protein
LIHSQLGSCLRPIPWSKMPWLLKNFSRVAPDFAKENYSCLVVQ